ncbi:MAG: SpoIIE family protein phosphatase [Planctomycetota bacterium]
MVFKLAASVTVTVLIGLAVLAIGVTASVGKSLENETKAMATRIVQGMATSTWESWYGGQEGDKTLAKKGSFDRLKALVEGSDGEIYQAYVQDARKVAFSKYKVQAGLDGGDQGGSTGWQEGTYGGKQAVLVRKEIRNEDGDPRGTANVILSLAKVEAIQGEVWQAFGLIAIVVVIAVFGIAWAAGSKIATPLETLVQAVSRINKGNLHYHSTIRGNDVVARLSRAIEQMTLTLQEGEEAHEALSAKENEFREASKLQEALLPAKLPVVEGFEIDATHVTGHNDGSSFYDAVPLGEGRLALVVASSSGRGILGALVAAMGRAFLHAQLRLVRDARKAMVATNRWLAQGMIKGLNLTVQCAVLDPDAGRATVYVAGHRAPFLACRAGEISVVHGEGLAIGLDKGKVFETRLEEVQVDMPAGTRIVMTTAGTYENEDADGQPIGVDAFQELVRKHAPKNSGAFLHLVHHALDELVGSEERERDFTIVTAKRMV